MSFRELTGSLASGGRFRLTGQLLEITGPDGNLLATFDIQTISAVQRNDKVVTLSRYSEGNITIITATDDDAGLLEHNVRAALSAREQPSRPAPPPPPAQQDEPPRQQPPGQAAGAYQPPPASTPPPQQPASQPSPYGQYQAPAADPRFESSPPPQQYVVPAAGAGQAAGGQPPEKKSNTLKYLLFGGIGCAALAVIACAGILVVAVLVSDDDGDPTAVVSGTATLAQQPTAESGTGTTQASGDPVLVSDVEIVFLGARDGENEIFGPDDGNKYVVAEFQVTNVSSEPYTLSTLLQFDIIDANGVEHGISIFPEMEGSLDGDIAAGQTIRGEVGFEVPQDSSPYTIRFSEFLSDESAEWEVS